MKIIIQRLFFIFSIILGLFLYDNSAIQAKKGDPATLNMTVYVYSDIKDMTNNIAGGGFVSVDVTIPVKKGDVWERNVLISKVIQYAEPALKNKTGSTYSISDLVIPPDSYSIIENDSLYVYPENEWRYDDNSKIKVAFNASDYANDYKFSINVLGHKGGKLNGWKAFSDNSRYYVNGKYLTGLQKVGQTTYLFNSYGGKQKGWHVINGQQVYFNEINGGLWTGKRKVGGTTYLFNSQGHKLYGWHRLNGKDYYFNNDNGGMWTGKRKIGTTTYLLHNDGYKIFGWYVDKYAEKYYFDPNYGGGMITGLRKVGNANYYFNTTYGDATLNGYEIVNNKFWYFNQNGVGSLLNF